MDGASVSACSKCGAAITATEKFCAACGAAVGSNAESGTPNATDTPAALPYAIDTRGALVAEREQKLKTARKWLVAISIITLLSGFVFYAIGSEEVEKQIRDAEAQTSGIDPVVRDQLMKQQTGMTFSEAVAHDRGQVTLLLAINIGLAIAYLVLWQWAKKNALAATVVALLLFITTIGVNAVMEPATLAQGIIVKILFIAALSKAVSSAQEERKLGRQLAAAG